MDNDFRPYLSEKYVEKHPEYEFRTKPALAKEILKEKLEQYNGRIPPNRITLLSDSSYATEEILGLSKETGINCVAILKKNRQIRLFSTWMRVDRYFARYKQERYFTDKETGVKVFYKDAVLDVKGLGRVKVFAIREDTEKVFKFYVTRKMKMTARTAQRYRKIRWKIDTMHRDAKQFCGLGNTCLWKEESLIPHFKAAFFLWWLFERYRMETCEDVSFEALWWEYKADVDRAKMLRNKIFEPPPISALFNYV